MGRPVATHQPTRRPSTFSRRTSALGYARGAVALLFGAMTTQSPLRPDAGAAPSAPGPGSLTVIYDADCGVCRETVRRLRRWDHEDRFVFVPLQAAAGCGRPRIEALAAEGHLAESVHVIDEATGRVVSGGMRPSQFSMPCRAAGCCDRGLHYRRPLPLPMSCIEWPRATGTDWPG